MSGRIKNSLIVLMFAALGSLLFGEAIAEDAVPAAQELQEVIITGTRITRTDVETTSPVQIITSEQMHQSGYTSVQDVLHNLTANGQGTLSQGFSGAFASGAAGIALRGLTVGSTLVLIDGHRSAPYPIGDDGQRTFVDISNLPFDAIERVEVLKDGASAIYGSDAIAGVVNIILRKSFEGASATAEVGQSSHADGRQVHFSGIWGAGDLANDGHNFYLSAEFRKQDEILFADRGGIFTQTDFTSTGGINTANGAQNILFGSTPRSGTGYIIDPNTGEAAGFMPGCDATKFAANQCTYADTWNQIQPPTRNINLVGRFTQNFATDWQVSIQGGYFEGKAEQVSDPPNSRIGGYQGVTSGPGVIPALAPLVGPTTISDTNPTFPTGTGLTSGILRYTLLNLGRGEVTATTSRTYRAVLDLNGKLGGWDTEFSAGYTKINLDVTGRNYLSPSGLQTALDSPTDPFLVGQPNSVAVNNLVAPPLYATDTSRLYFGHAGATRSLMDLAGGPLGFAAGLDYFDWEQNTLAPAPVASGLVMNFSNNFTVGTQRVSSAYVEVDAPFHKQFEVDAAVRYDHYNISGGKASPKIGFKYTPIPKLAIRGTASKGFRAPSPAENGTSGQTFFAGASADPILCPDPLNITAPGNFVGQCVVNVATVQGTNPALKPETSTSFTLGFIIEPTEYFSAALDFYSIEVDDQIVVGGPSTTVRGTNFTPIAQYQAGGGTPLVTPPVAPIAFLTSSYINANSTKVGGVDLGMKYDHSFDSGDFRSELTWSYLAKYDLIIDGTTYELAGTHGPFIVSGNTGNPQNRIQWANTFGRGKWQVTGTFNYISSFDVTDPSAIASIGAPLDTCAESLVNGGGAASTDYANVLDPDDPNSVPSAVSCKVASYLTFDLYARVKVGEHLDVHGSILNLFNEKAPLDWQTYGGALGAVPYNPSLHSQGAIGPYFMIGVTYTLSH